jgi:hypothetical protein
MIVGIRRIKSQRRWLTPEAIPAKRPRPLRGITSEA